MDVKRHLKIESSGEWITGGDVIVLESSLPLLHVFGGWDTITAGETNLTELIEYISPFVPLSLLVAISIILKKLIRHHKKSDDNLADNSELYAYRYSASTKVQTISLSGFLGAASSLVLHLFVQFRLLISSYGIEPSLVSWLGFSALIAFLLYGYSNKAVMWFEKSNTTCPKCNVAWVWDKRHQETISNFVKYKTEKVDGRDKQVAYNCKRYWQYCHCHNCDHAAREERVSETRG